MQMIDLDGSHGEGGGQILRTAIGLSALTGTPCRIFNIRKGRAKPGLANQHLTAIKAVAQICDGKLKGAEVGSTEIVFEPNKIKPGHYKFDIGTAGSTTLVLQSLLIPALGCEAALKITSAEGASYSSPLFQFDIVGGTDNPWAPTSTYMQHIFQHFIQKMGAQLEIQTVRHGFYPKGGGLIRVKTGDAKWSCLKLLERGQLQRIDAISVASEDLKKGEVAERQLAPTENITGPLASKEIIYTKTSSPGSSLNLFAHFQNTIMGASALGDRGKKAEQVGEQAQVLLMKQMQSGACLDEWMSDQILPYMAIATCCGISEVRVAEITEHALTNIWVIEKFLPVKFFVKGNKGEAGIVSVKGI